MTSPLTPAVIVKSCSTARFKHVTNDPKCFELGWTCVPLAVETWSRAFSEQTGPENQPPSYKGVKLISFKVQAQVKTGDGVTDNHDAVEGPKQIIGELCLP